MRVRTMVLAAALVTAGSACSVSGALASIGKNPASVERSGCINDAGVTRVVADTTQCAPTEAAVVWRT